MGKIPFWGTLIFLLHFSSLSAQYTISGIINDEIGNPIIGANILDVKDQVLGTSNREGKFSFEVESEDEMKLNFSAAYFQDFTLFAYPGSGDLLTVIMKRSSGSLEENDFQLITLSDDEVNSGNNSQNVSSILQASRDVFANLTAFTFNAARFRGRGFDGGYTRMLLNGMPVNDLDDGRVNWSYWGGLNDVLRNTQSTYGLDDSENTFGDIGGTQSIDLRASFQRKQIRPAFAISNRSYRNRAMFTYSSGVIDNKYAVSVSGSRRWGNEGYADATFYDAYSYFLSFDYLINKNNTINLVALGAPARRGRSGASVQEMNDLAGNNYYNPNWGYQNGKKRNSRMYNSFQPIFMLRHDLKLNTKLDLSTTLSFQTGRFGSSRLDWYNVSDPRPDYYRKLPSFYSDNPEIADYITTQLQEESNRQIDWDYLYFINKNTTEDFVNANGVEGKIQSGHRAKYLLSEQRFDAQKMSVNTIAKYNISSNFRINGGVNIMRETNRNFQTALDLLGGDYYVDLDKFAEREFAPNSAELQNDLNNPNKIIFEGDTYGYDYSNVTDKALGWAIFKYNTRRFDFFGGGELSNTSFYREGFMKNGKFPENSFGKSEVNSFTNYAIKGGISYKINGRNYVNLIATQMTKAPLTRFSFVSPRTRHDVVEGIQSSEIFSSELSYHHKSPGLKAKVSAFYATFKNQTEVTSFYYDVLRTFVNQVVTGIDQRHMGVELAADVKLSTTLSAVAAASIGDYVYTSRPTADLSQDNNAQLLEDDVVIYQKNFYVPNTPQNAYTVGLKYNSPKYWFLNVNLNYFDKIYLDFSQIRRTQNAVSEISKIESPELWASIINQERVPANFTLDLFGGKSWKIGSRFIYFTAGINNILNNQKFVIGGYEQSRYDFRSNDVGRFPSRYFYAYGTNYFIGLSFRL